MSHQPRHLVLVGEMGVGKSTIGSRVATRLSREFLDSDELLGERAKQTGAELASEASVEELHEVELELFLDAVQRRQPAVIAPAASVVDVEIGRRALREQLNVWLHADAVVVDDRRLGGPHRRKVARDEAAALRERRRQAFADCSRLWIDTGKETVDGCVDAIVELADSDLKQ